MFHTLAVLFIALQVADWWTTRRVLAHGGRETNPVMRWVIERFGLNGLLAVKLAGAALIVWLFSMHWIGTWALAAACVFYAWIVQHNYRQVRNG